MTTNVETSEIVDLANLGGAAQTVRYVRSLDLMFDGAGTLDATSTLFWMQWVASGLPRNCKITQINTGANGGWTITGSFSLLSFEVSADRRKQGEATISLGVSGPWTVLANT